MPYECKLCGARFTGYGAKSRLDSHLETAHPEEYLMQKNRYHTGGRSVRSPAEKFNAAAAEVDPAAIVEGGFAVIKTWHDAPTIEDYRDWVERITGIDFEGAKPRDSTWKDWKNLVHFLKTEVGDCTDTSETDDS